MRFKVTLKYKYIKVQLGETNSWLWEIYLQWKEIKRHKFAIMGHSHYCNLSYLFWYFLHKIFLQISSVKNINVNIGWCSVHGSLKVLPVGWVSLSVCKAWTSCCIFPPQTKIRTHFDHSRLKISIFFPQPFAHISLCYQLNMRFDCLTEQITHFI